MGKQNQQDCTNSLNFSLINFFLSCERGTTYFLHIVLDTAQLVTPPSLWLLSGFIKPSVPLISPEIPCSAALAVVSRSCYLQMGHDRSFCADLHLHNNRIKESYIVRFTQKGEAVA